MTRRNRVDPFGDLHAVEARGMFTGNRGCLVDETGQVKRHHRGQLWITCLTSYRGWRSPLDMPGHWTPLFFLDDAVALSAGHRPCGLCRGEDYLSYQEALTRSLGRTKPVRATEMNRILAAERLKPGRGLDRAADRKLWETDSDRLPDGTVVLADAPLLIFGDSAWTFSFDGWTRPQSRPEGRVDVITPPTSVRALESGFSPRLHGSMVL